VRVELPVYYYYYYYYYHAELNVLQSAKGHHNAHWKSSKSFGRNETIQSNKKMSQSNLRLYKSIILTMGGQQPPETLVLSCISCFMQPDIRRAQIIG